jgi:hypothetical protein
MKLPANSNIWMPPPASTSPPSFTGTGPIPRASDFAHMANTKPGNPPEPGSSASVKDWYWAYRGQGLRPEPKKDDFQHHHPAQPEDNAAYARFQLVFEWLLNKLVGCLSRLDNAAFAWRTADQAGQNTGQAKNDYQAAYDDFNKFVADLEGGNPDVYGNLVKSVLRLEPRVWNDRILGVTFEVEWNPHSSSSMIHP